MELKQAIKQSFIDYAGGVLQSRALVDARDYIKPSARQIFYSMYLNKLVHSKPFKKTNNAIGLAMADFYIHGDSSAEGIIMRAGQPFAYRYPLVEVEGSYGNLMESGNHAAPRYTASRLSELAEYLFKDIDKEVISEWRDNYDDTKQYPSVLPSKGFCNLVNGSSGVGIGMAASLPQYNLRELNEALIKLLWNPDVDFEEIYCAPDFATGAILLNEAEVKESMKNGNGRACMLRSVVDFDAKDRCFVVTEIPYGVYTNTICGQLENILNSEENPGIDRFNDLTGSTPLLKIYLNKSARPERVLKYLYKNTSLQYHFGINMTMLENGRYPRVFTWKDALGAHLNHEIEVYRRGFEYDLKKINDRLHIIDGLLKAISILDEVIATIKVSNDTKSANSALCTKFGFTAAQAKAILDIKLARLAHLEIAKLEKEKSDLLVEKARIEAILQDDTLLKKEIENGLREVAKKFGDDRRTKILNITDEEGEPIEVKTLQLSLTNMNSIFITEVSSLYTQRRGGVGSKLKMAQGEYVVSTNQVDTNQTILFFTNDGEYYTYKASALITGEKMPVEAFLPLKEWQKIRAIAAIGKSDMSKSILFITKQGMIKKSLLSEYNTNRNIGIKALTLDNDEIVCALFTEKERVGIVTEAGNFLMIETKDIRPLGRISKGIRAIKLNPGDGVSAAHIIPENTKEVVSISSSGLAKKTPIRDFLVQGKNTKGAKIQKIGNDEYVADFAAISNEKDILIAATKSCIRISLEEVPSLSKGAQGNKTIKLGNKESVVGMSKF